jgi:hypothetical protein
MFGMSSMIFKKAGCKSKYCADRKRETEDIYERGMKNRDEGIDEAKKSQTKAKLEGQVLCFNKPKR